MGGSKHSDTLAYLSLIFVQLHVATFIRCSCLTGHVRNEILYCFSGCPFVGSVYWSAQFRKIRHLVSTCEIRALYSGLVVLVKVIILMYVVFGL